MMQEAGCEIDILIASDESHESVVAEIYYQEQFVALVSQDNGPENAIVEIPGAGLDEGRLARSVPVAVFQSALNMAINRLVSG